MSMSKILYAAGTMDHIKSFHLPYIEALRADGHEVLVMAKGRDADFDIAFVKKMVTAKNIACRRKIKKILKEHKFDAIILNTTLAAFNIRLCLPRRNRPRVINLVHGYMFPKQLRNFKDKLFLFCEKYLRKRTDAIMVMNDEDYSIATENNLCLGDVVMTSGMGALVPETVVPKETIRKYTGTEGKYILCFVGELYRAKNQRMLICALPEIQLAIPNAVLMLVGEGADRFELISLAEELNISSSVYFAGKKKNPCDYIRASDLYVSASEKEGLPFNIVESLGCGQVTLVSDIKGHRDIIEEGKSGFIYPPGDITEFVSKVKKIHSGELKINPDDAIERYKKYSRDVVFDKTYGTMKELLSK
jgi:glycosyltransferase EpsD